MQPCRNCTQQMAPTVRQQDDLFIWNNSGWHDSCLHANCKLSGMVAMKSYLGAKTRDCALERSELFGSTRRKLNLHQPNKVNYSILCPNTRTTRQCIEEPLTFAEHDVVHTTSMLETECLISNWHIGRLPPNSAKQCWALQAIIWTICNAKVGSSKHDTPAPTYKGLKKEFRPINNMEYEFWFCPDDIKRCVIGTK